MNPISIPELSKLSRNLKNLGKWRCLLEARCVKEETKLKIEERRLEKEEKRKENLKYKESETTYDHSLMDQVKRLKRLYKNGTLSKAEFEKAKNKLLK